MRQPQISLFNAVINYKYLTFYSVVDKHPEAKTLFQRVRIDDPDSGEFLAHCLRIFNSFDHLVNLLHDKQTLREASAHLGYQHAARPGVRGTYFRVSIDIIETHCNTLKYTIFNFYLLQTYISYAISILSEIDYRFHIIAWEACLNDLLKGVFEAIPA